jgi:hypothetical protein
VNGEPLSEQACKAMQQDFQTHLQQTEPKLSRQSQSLAQPAQQKQPIPKPSRQGAEIGE